MASSAYAKLDRPVDSDNSENENEARTPRSSEEARRHDQETLHAEEEAERLLGGGGEKAAGQSAPRRQKRRRKGGGNREKGESEQMYAMEEGGRASESSSGNSSEVDLQRLREVQGRKVGWPDVDEAEGCCANMECCRRAERLALRASPSSTS